MPHNAFRQFFLFPSSIVICTDATNFFRNAVKNFHSNQVTTKENPHEVLEDRWNSR